MDQLKAKLPEEIYDCLVNANIKSLSFITNLSKCELAHITKLDLKSTENILRESSYIMLNNKLHIASEIETWKRISTGCSSIDQITKGGIGMRGITEIFGCSGVGKTQFCLQLSLMTQLPRHLGGVEKGVVYICTEDVFPIKRLNELARYFTTNKYKSNYEDNIFIEHISDFIQLKECLCTRLPKLMSVKKIGLVVIDSIAGVFRSENCDVNYVNRSQDFILLASELNRLSSKHGFAVVCVNQVTDNLSSGSTEPCLGLAWSNVVTCRYKLCRNFKSAIREFEIIFAPDLADDSCKFKIIKEGLAEVD